jgi:hypothetical protein
MRSIFRIVFVAALLWFGYTKYQGAVHRADLASERPSSAAPSTVTKSTSEVIFRCDGRTYCSQMTSCAEATYFIEHCPGTKMDGNNDGVPCEQQWCKRAKL